MKLLLFVHLIAACCALAAQPCASCHPKQVAAYEKTGMGRSMSRVARQPSGQFMHAVSGTEFQIRAGAAGMTHRLEREGIEGAFKVSHVIGSGNHAFGYLVNVGGYLFQSPVSYYTKRAVWDMAPGFEADRNPDISRPVTAECLLCHTGGPRPVPNTLNKYEQPPFEPESISCDRCHGPSEKHVLRPSAATIISPVRLAARARDSTCEQCHLSGEARIAHPGKQIGDFRPGQELEEVFSAYVFDAPVDSGLTVISHVQQLARSVCKIESGDRLWCGTCHNPHESPSNVKAHHRAKCLECHAGVEATHSKPADDCVGCHMPARPAKDGGHTAFTDHRIQRTKTKQMAPRGGPSKLVAWAPGAAEFAERNLGLAYVTVGERDRSAFHMDEGERLLQAARSKFSEDGALLTSLGLLALRQRKTGEAIALFEGALKTRQMYAPYMVNLATGLKEARRMDEAAQYLDRAIALDPSLEVAYRRLAEIEAQRRQPDRVRAVFERFLRFMPNSVTARIAAAQ